MSAGEELKPPRCENWGEARSLVVFIQNCLDQVSSVYLHIASLEQLPGNLQLAASLSPAPL